MSVAKEKRRKNAASKAKCNAWNHFTIKEAMK